MKRLIFLLSLFAFSRLCAQTTPELEFTLGPGHSFYQEQGAGEGFSPRFSLWDGTIGGRFGLNVSDRWALHLSLYAYQACLEYEVEALPKQVRVCDPLLTHLSLGLRRYFPLGDSHFKAYLSTEIGFAEARYDSMPGLLYYEQSGDDYEFRIFRELRPRRSVSVNFRGTGGLRYVFPFGLGFHLELYYQQGVGRVSDFSYVLVTANGEKTGTLKSRGSRVGMQTGLSWTFPPKKKKVEIDQ